MIILKKLSVFKFTVAIILLLAMTAIFSCYPISSAENEAAVPDENWQNFAGTWEGTDDDAVMRLFLTVDAAGKTVYGSHKAISYDGQRADMVSETSISINGTFIGGKVAEVDWIGGYNPADRGSGTAKITLLDDNTIKWERLTVEGAAYIPYEMQLKKISPTAAEPKYIIYKNAWSIFDLKTKKQFTLGSPVKNVFAALGRPKSESLFLGGSSQAKSGVVYNYDGLEILAKNDGEIAYFLIDSDRFITSGDLRVGDPLEKLIGLYGSIEKNKKIKDGELEWYTYILDNNNEFKSSFGIKGEVIKAIRFSIPLNIKTPSPNPFKRTAHL